MSRKQNDLLRKFTFDKGHGLALPLWLLPLGEVLLVVFMQYIIPKGYIVMFYF